MAGPRKQMQPEQVRAAALLGALLLSSLTVWAVAGLTADPGPDQAGTVARGGEPPADDQLGDTDDPEASAGRGSAREDVGDERSDEETSVTIEFDGLCEVELDPAHAGDDPRPWDFDACERAPIRLNGSQQRWIVVIASLSGEDFTEQGALQRVDGRGSGQQLLWSSHYPSLNPGLWVIVDGPFADERAAVRAADALGGGAYPRALSDTASDRYCATNDGCVGETRGGARR